ncbi:hypothetical protein THRCLA_22842, partial [Thraustotheca clavata]
EAQGEGKDDYLPGVISRCRLDGSYDVKFFTGDEETFIGAERIKRLQKQLNLESSTENQQVLENEITSPLKKDSDELQNAGDDQLAVDKSTDWHDSHPQQLHDENPIDENPTDERPIDESANDEGPIDESPINGNFVPDEEIGNSEVAVNVPREPEHQVNDAPQKIFERHQRVKVQVENSTQLEMGVISRCRLNGTYDVEFDTGERETGVSADYIEAVTWPPTQDYIPLWHVGDLIEARCRGKTKYVPGIIAKVYTTLVSAIYEVHFENGTIQDKLDEEDIHLLRRCTDNASVFGSSDRVCVYGQVGSVMLCLTNGCYDVKLDNGDIISTVAASDLTHATEVYERALTTDENDNTSKSQTLAAASPIEEEQNDKSVDLAVGEPVVDAMIAQQPEKSEEEISFYDGSDYLSPPELVDTSLMDVALSTTEVVSQSNDDMGESNDDNIELQGSLSATSENIYEFTENNKVRAADSGDLKGFSPLHCQEDSTETKLQETHVLKNYPLHKSATRLVEDAIQIALCSNLGTVHSKIATGTSFDNDSKSFETSESSIEIKSISPEEIQNHFSESLIGEAKSAADNSFKAIPKDPPSFLTSLTKDGMDTNFIAQTYPTRNEDPFALAMAINDVAESACNFILASATINQVKEHLALSALQNSEKKPLLIDSTLQNLLAESATDISLGGSDVEFKQETIGDRAYQARVVHDGNMVDDLASAETSANDVETYDQKANFNQAEGNPALIAYHLHATECSISQFASQFTGETLASAMSNHLSHISEESKHYIPLLSLPSNSIDKIAPSTTAHVEQYDMTFYSTLHPTERLGIDVISNSATDSDTHRNDIDCSDFDMKNYNNYTKGIQSTKSRERAHTIHLHTSQKNNTSDNDILPTRQLEHKVNNEKPSVDTIQIQKHKDYNKTLVDIPSDDLVIPTEREAPVDDIKDTVDAPMVDASNEYLDDAPDSSVPQQLDEVPGVPVEVAEVTAPTSVVADLDVVSVPSITDDAVVDDSTIASVEDNDVSVNAAASLVAANVVADAIHTAF